MGAEPSRPNPPRNNYDYPDYNRAYAYRPTPAPRQPQTHAQTATDYRGSNIHRTTPNSANPATNTASTSGGLTPIAARTRAQDPPTSGVTRLTNQTVNSATGGVPKPPTITSATTGASRIDTWVTSTIPHTLEVQKVVNLSVSPASTRVSRPTTAASSGVLKPNTAVSTTGSVAKPTSSSVYYPVTCEVSKPLNAPPSIGVLRNNAGTIPTIIPRTSEVPRVTSQRVVIPSSNGAPSPTTTASAGVLKPNTAVSTTESVAKPTSSSVYYPVTCEVSKPLNAPPSIGVLRNNAGTIPTIIPRTSEVPRLTRERVVIPSSNGVPSPTTTASAGVFKATTAAPTSGTGEVRKPTSSSLSSGQVTSTQSIYPELPEVANTCEDNLNKLRSLLREQARMREERNQTAASEKTVGTPASSEGVNHESKRQTSSHPIDYSTSGGKSQTSCEGIEPSCPEYSLLDPLGVSSYVPNGSVESSGSNVDHGSRARVENSDYAGKESDIGLPDLKRDSSPLGSASSHASRLSSVGGNRGRPKRSKSRKPKKKVDNSEDPPQYGDVVAEINADHKNTENKIPTRKNPPQRQVKVPDRKDNQRPGRPNTMDDRFRPKNVDELNDLIKKEFGSLGEPTHNLPFVIEREKLFSGRNRLFVGNLPFNVTREDVNELMAPYGEIVVDHHNAEKKFGFVTLKHRDQAENAQRNLDGYVFKGRSLRVRLANRHICFKVLNLDAWVTNELLKKAFSAFGDVERAEIVVEDGKPTGEGFLEFSDRRAGKMALQACVENCFLLTSSLRPVILREIDPDYCSRGFSERQINKNNATYIKAREVGPRFVPEGSKESDCANLWKSFYERRRRGEEELAKRMQQEENLLEERIRSMTS